MAEDLETRLTTGGVIPKTNTADGVVDCPEGYTLMPIPNHYLKKHSPYHREIFPGVYVDVYKILDTYQVTNSASAHEIKKALMPGERHGKSRMQDLKEAAWSASKAVQLEVERQDLKGEG